MCVNIFYDSEAHLYFLDTLRAQLLFHKKCLVFHQFLQAESSKIALIVDCICNILQVNN